MARKFTRQQRLALLRAWQESGVPRTRFAEQHGISPATFRWWVREERRRAAEENRPDAEPVYFLEVTPSDQPVRPSAPVELRLGEDVLLSLTELPPADWLAAVARSLAAC